MKFYERMPSGEIVFPEAGKRFGSGFWGRMDGGEDEVVDWLMGNLELKLAVCLFEANY